jgi:outer membrane PBP1 activator LpoA protein
LTKPDVQTIAKMGELPAPTLALNYLDPHQAAPAQLYQFGLSPLDEARQAAALARQNGAQSALIIAPDNNWGATVAQGFQNQWQALGGNVADTLFFTGAIPAWAAQIRDFLRFKQSDKNTPPNRRQDFDVIFLAADPHAARQIRPLLKFYSAGNVPVYATSLIYSGAPQPALDNDLNGIVFCDVPWILNKRTALATLRQRLALFWPLDFRQNIRLYALGVDAYYLAEQLSRLAISPAKNFAGATGVLSLNDQQRMVRKLTCMQFRAGIPSPLQ